MPLSSIIGLDHVVIVVRDLAAAAAVYERLGFTVSPRGTHSAHMGTANHTIMLGDDYIELMGVLAPTERNAATRAFLGRREGIERVALTASSAEDLARELREAGWAATGPLDFSRPVDLADGRRTEARFRTTLWPSEERPGDTRMFACEHLTRDAVWLPHLQRHANSAVAIDRVELLSPNPAAAAEHLGRMLGQPVGRAPDGAHRVASGGGRAAFEFLDRDGLECRHPGVPIDGLADEGAAALSLLVSDLAAAASALAQIPSIAGPDRIEVAPAHACGVLLELRRA